MNGTQSLACVARCSRVVVVWTASTECLVPEEAGINDTAANLMSMLEQESADGDLQTVSPSQVRLLCAGVGGGGVVAGIVRCLVFFFLGGGCGGGHLGLGFLWVHARRCLWGGGSLLHSCAPLFNG